ncbi:Clan SC, family S9, unassigned serine peptidase [Tritrichomonas foetus]|uniref:Clan SC, family S9, unassigned serine peptidase n=1 Tax=Tritrichomonas foetus TaxID=1144522 RepID=A0A1J4JLF3_9EUKA|nr:Clan SC, family S9, unassigned serine peptidase [Tritrichomonas foetus]|eukprot:OHS98100.1 Clan SC, family S9, unassigned serine peptidase [Tritrichomonas foetus]
MEIIDILKQAIETITRPPRRKYNINSLPTTLISDDGHQYKRYPVENLIIRGHQIIGSLYSEISKDIKEGGPCVIYSHGNASSQIEGLFLIPHLCHNGITVFLYDCVGCGESDGEYITLGYSESIDLQLIISELSSRYNFDKFILWGRSMGAAMSIMCSHPKIVGAIADSTFSSVRDIIFSVTENQLKMPKFLSKIIVWFMRMVVLDSTDLDINDVSPIDSAHLPNKPPLIIGHATNDDFIPYSQGENVYHKYSNDEVTLVQLSHGHNGKRSTKWYKTCFSFIFEKLNIAQYDLQIRHFKGIHMYDDHFASAMDMINNERVGISEMKTSTIDQEQNSNIMTFEFYPLDYQP